MNRTVLAAIIGLILSAPGAAGAATHDNASVVQQCWAPAQLAGRPEEKAAHATRQDAPSPALDGLHPAPVSTIGAIRRVKLPKGRKLVALTFDVCEAVREVAGYDGGVIDYLRANNVKATLFVGGKWMADHPERAQQLVADEHFEIGTHGWAHVNLHVETGRAVTDEILGATAAYDSTRKALAARACVRAAGLQSLPSTPPQPRVFRFPFGACHTEALNAVARAGLLAIQWDVATGDPSPAASAAKIARAVLAEAKPGSIIIAHANGRGWHTAEALPLFIPEMRRRGYEFVTVSELLAAGTPEIVPTCYDRHPGDSDRYDTVQLRRDRALKGGAPSRAPSGWPASLEWAR